MKLKIAFSHHSPFKIGADLRDGSKIIGSLFSCLPHPADKSMYELIFDLYTAEAPVGSPMLPDGTCPNLWRLIHEEGGLQIVSEETVHHPHHYGGGDNPYEAIKVIEAWNLGFSLGNAVKYISRAFKKDKSKAGEDLRKARWYLNREIEKLEGKKEAGAVPQPPSVDEAAESERLTGRLEAIDDAYAIYEDVVRSFQRDVSIGKQSPTADYLREFGSRVHVRREEIRRRVARGSLG